MTEAPDPAQAPGGAGDFELLNERVISSTWVTFAEATFRAPDGSQFTREVVHHPGAVSVVPLMDDLDTVVLVRQYRAALGRYILELPAGKRDVEGEAPETTARRELVEEIGMSARRIDRLCAFYNSPGFSDEYHYSFLARDLDPGEISRQSIEEEHMTTEQVSLRRLPHLIADSVVTDAKTIIGLMLARDFLISEAGHAGE